MRSADTDALEEEYTNGYDIGYAQGVRDSEPYERAVKAVREALNEVLQARNDPDRLQGYELHEIEGQQELARTLLVVINDAWEGRS